MWHERGFWNTQSGTFNQHRAQFHTFNFGKHLVGGSANGTLYQMSISLLDDFGNVIRRVRRAPHISMEQEWTFHQQLQVDIETGMTPQPNFPDAPPLLQSDNFNRVNNAFSLGANWTNTVGSFGIFSNGATVTNTINVLNAAIAFWSASVFSPDQISQVTVSVISTNTTRTAGPAVRCSAGNCYGFFIDPIGGTYSLYKIIGGVTLTVLSTGAATSVNGDVLELDAVGDLLTAKKNGVTVATANDTDLPLGSSGLAGFGIIGGFNPILDNWSGGDANQIQTFHGPQANLRRSDDGGHTWSNLYSVDCGTAGNYRTRAIWRRLGRSRDRVYELSVSDPVPWRVVDAYLLATPGYTPQERLTKQMTKIS
jgi:hypothetical protein